MKDEVRVSFGGDELELKRISAAQYLSAGAEAEKLVKESGFRSDGAKAVILGACLLSRGLYGPDGAAYPTAKAILDSVSAEEILETANLMIPDAAAGFELSGRLEKLRTGASDTVSGDSGSESSRRIGQGTDTVGEENAENRNSDDSGDMEDMQLSDLISNNPSDANNDDPVRDKRSRTSDEFYRAGDYLALSERVMRPDINSGINTATNEKPSAYIQGNGLDYDADNAVYPDVIRGTGRTDRRSNLSPRDGMRRVSDFFQRDSRRYDGIITSY